MTSTVEYKGELRTEAVHLKSSNSQFSDAPTDNQGKGENFSPTDLIATALAQCALTIMGIKARDLNIDILGSKAEVIKEMGSNPRKIDAIKIKLMMSYSPSEKERIILERSALTCPVALSLHNSIQQELSFTWK